MTVCVSATAKRVAASVFEKNVKHLIALRSECLIVFCTEPVSQLVTVIDQFGDEVAHDLTGVVHTARVVNGTTYFEKLKVVRGPPRATSPAVIPATAIAALTPPPAISSLTPPPVIPALTPPPAISALTRPPAISALTPPPAIAALTRPPAISALTRPPAISALTQAPTLVATANRMEMLRPGKPFRFYFVYKNAPLVYGIHLFYGIHPFYCMHP